MGANAESDPMPPTQPNTRKWKWEEIKLFFESHIGLFENELGLEVVFKGYVGGWEPRIYIGSGTSLVRKATNKAISILASTLDKIQALRRFNSKWWSGYAIAVYRKSV